MTKLEEAITTCDGLHHLLRRLNGAAVDLDKGGESAHELLALLASTNECISNLSAQLDSIQHVDGASNLPDIRPVAEKSHNSI